MPSVGTAFQALAELGPRPLFYMARYQLAEKSGWLRRQTPSGSWESRPLASWLRPDVPAASAAYLDFRRTSAPHFFFSTEQDLAPDLQRVLGSNAPALRTEGQEILNGNFRFFGGKVAQLGFPPDWNAFPARCNSVEAPLPSLHRHWSSFPGQDLQGDIKFLWELSRFAWVYPLARAYRLCKDPRYAAGFWDLLESWRSQNQPNIGPQWISAQEVALRMLALVFAMYAFWPWLEADAEKVAILAAMIASHAERIPPSLDYARAQENNHLLSESTALYTAGLLFPEFEHAERWKRIGRRELERGIERQFMPDGGYVQFSTNYHRLALQLCSWAVQLAHLHGEPLDPVLVRKAGKGASFMRALVDPRTGKAPNWGHNDGSNVLPLACAEEGDFRPALQVAWAVLNGKRLYDRGHWDEALVWFGVPVGDQAIASTSSSSHAPATSRFFPHAGLHLMRGSESRAFLRCARFRCRPAHSDQLHLDLWFRGLNFVRDAGTYLYNGVPPWQNGLAAAQVHNGPVVNGREPMLRAGRFLWLRWAQGRLLHHEKGESNAWEMVVVEHSGYHPGVMVRRTVLRLGDTCWHVCDEILGEGAARVALAWLLPDAEWRRESNTLFLSHDGVQAEVRVQGIDAWGLIREGKQLAGDQLAGQDERLGWISTTYGRKLPALSYCLQADRPLPLQVRTMFLFADESNTGEVEWHAPGEGRVPLRRLRFAGQDLEF